MHVYSLQLKSELHTSIEEAWAFFSNPSNLNELTPADLSFQTLSDLKGKSMYAGMIINYKIRPFLNIPFRWTTEITQCVKNNYFIDEQRFGPYAFWHHEHRFIEHNGYLEMIDTVYYALPFGILGRVLNSLFIERKLKSIFAFRYMKVEGLFGAASKDGQP